MHTDVVKAPGWLPHSFFRYELWEHSLGTEVEMSNNFVAAGFFPIPAAAVKWTF